MKEKLRLFDRAYDKAARCQAGEDPQLTESEESILMACISAYEDRKTQALERFRQYMSENYPDMPDHQVKAIFKEECRRNKMPFSGYKPKKKKR